MTTDRNDLITAETLAMESNELIQLYARIINRFSDEIKQLFVDAMDEKWGELGEDQARTLLLNKMTTEELVEEKRLVAALAVRMANKNYDIKKTLTSFLLSCALGVVGSVIKAV